MRRIILQGQLKAAIVAFCTIGMLFAFISIGFSQPGEITNKPALKAESQAQWRVGYVEGEPFVNFAGTFYYLLKGLQQVGWLENIDQLPFRTGQEDTYSIWQWLVENDTGPYIKFVSDAHYSLSDPGVASEDIHGRLERGDLDLLIVMGTRAGREMSKEDYPVPVLVFSTSNAVQAGIIKSELDSGRDNLWAHMDIGRFRRQIEVFYDIFQFQRLGMLYEDSDIGRVFAAVSDVEQLALEKDFLIYTEYVNNLDTSDPLDRERYYEEILAAHKRLAQQVDAMYITVGNWEPEYLPILLEPFYANNIPVFSQQGSNEVRHGALLSLYRADFSGIGRFGALTIVRVLQGKSPRSLTQIHGDTPSIVINLKVAELIGYRVPFEILLVADEIFLDIGTPSGAR